MKRLAISLFFLVLPVLAQMPPMPPGVPGQGIPAPAPPGGMGAPMPQGQGGGLPLPRLPQSYPLPQWIRPGLVMIYRDIGGMITKAYLVTDVTATDAYGLEITLMHFPDGSTVIQRQVVPFVQNGAGYFYVNPQAAAEYLKSAPQAAQTGVKITGGPGILAIEEQGQGGKSGFALRFDPNSGVVQQITAMVKTQKGSTAADFRYQGYDFSPMPSLPDFPPAAREAHSYRLSTAVPGFGGSPGMTMPSGEIKIVPAGVFGRLARYQITAVAQGYPFQRPGFGVPAGGPHYLHPALLRQGVVYRIAKLSLTVQAAGSGPHGGVVVQTLLGQVPLAAQEYHPQSGLLLYAEESYGSLGQMITELEQ